MSNQNQETIKMADSQADLVKSPIIMKVDSPKDDKDENDDNEKTEIDINPNQICAPSTLSKPVIASSKFGISNSFIPKTNNMLANSKFGNKSLLRPPQLGQPSPVKPAFSLNPSKLNPFARPNEDNGCSTSTSTTNGDTPKFVPLLDTEKNNSVKSLPTNMGPTQSHSFVFGQNLQARVIEGTDDPKPSTSCVEANGSSSYDMLFSSAIKETPTLPDTTTSSTPNKSLSESAREYEEQRANKRKYEEVEVKTGEEDETNVVHLSCKLFAYDKTGGVWQERGRGNLRLNDQHVWEDGKSHTQSRLVFRTSGVLRVILNTKIWAAMTVEKSSEKSVRFTAIDKSGEIRVYLVMANPEEIRQLHNHIQDRLLYEQRRQTHKKVLQSAEEESGECSTTTAASSSTTRAEATSSSSYLRSNQ